MKQAPGSTELEYGPYEPYRSRPVLYEETESQLLNTVSLTDKLLQNDQRLTDSWPFGGYTSLCQVYYKSVSGTGV